LEKSEIIVNYQQMRFLKGADYGEAVEAEPVLMMYNTLSVKMQPDARPPRDHQDRPKDDKSALLP
jgi:hypothetical protein